MAPPKLETYKIFDTMFSNAFQAGLTKAQADHAIIATEIPSTTAINTYAWLGSFPQMRQWIGAREAQGLSDFRAYQLENKPYEITVKVPVEAIEDDQFGLYAPIAEEMGYAVRQHPGRLVFQALYNGAEAESLCYDGKPFFATDHPKDGTAWSNYTAGAGEPWVLADATRPLKPIILQMRRKPELVGKNQAADDNVFWEKELVWGADGRYVVGYGFPQLAHMSKATLNEDNFAAVKAAMMKLVDAKNNPIMLNPSILIVGPDNEHAARKLLLQSAKANGEDNILKGIVDLHVTPYFRAA